MRKNYPIFVYFLLVEGYMVQKITLLHAETKTFSNFARIYEWSKILF